MKKVIFLVLMFLSLTSMAGNGSLVIAQEYKYAKKVNLNLSSNYGSGHGQSKGFHYGHGMMIGGGSFLLAGVLTGRDFVGLTGPEYQPYTNQPGRLAAIITGSVMLLSGVIVTFTI